MNLRYSWRYILYASLTALVLTGCGGPKQQRQSAYAMGEKMRVGNLIYTVLEAQWRPALGESVTQRIPQNRFLLLRLTITNSGGQEVNVPLLNLVDAQGNEIPEQQSGEGVNNWLGLFRTVTPAQTADGWIVFDVAPSNYALRVTDAAGPENEQTLLINIPLSMDSIGDAGPTAIPATQP